jgi:hypothetical protein
MATPQNYKNHARMDPPFHYFLIPLALLCFIASIMHVVKQPTPPNVLLVPVTFALLFGCLMIRRYSLTVQNRVIRLEEQTRLRALGVDPAGLTMKQFVALRFASDNEVGDLVARAKAEHLEPKQIKEAIATWRPDYERV